MLEWDEATVPITLVSVDFMGWSLRDLTTFFTKKGLSVGNV